MVCDQPVQQCALFLAQHNRNIIDRDIQKQGNFAKGKKKAVPKSLQGTVHGPHVPSSGSWPPYEETIKLNDLQGGGAKVLAPIVGVSKETGIMRQLSILCTCKSAVTSDKSCNVSKFL